MRRRAANPTEATLDRSDAQTALGSLADTLRVHAHAVRGLAAEAGAGPGSPEGREHARLAAGLGEAADLLDLLRASLCPRCALADVTTRVAVEARR